MARASIVAPRGPTAEGTLRGEFFHPDDVRELANAARLDLAPGADAALVARRLSMAASHFVSSWRLDATMTPAESQRWAKGLEAALRDVMDRLGFHAEGEGIDPGAWEMLARVQPKSFRAERTHVAADLPWLAMVARRAAQAYAERESGVRSPNSAERILVRDLGGAFEYAFARKAARSTDPATNEPRGPAIRFMAKAAAIIADRDAVIVDPHPVAFRDEGRVTRLRALAEPPHHALAELLRVVKRGG